MAPLAQNVRKDPQIAPWFNNNTEFEGGRRNMMDFSCMKAVYECTRLPPWQKKIFLTRYSGVSLTKKPAARRRKYHKNIMA